MIFLALSLLLLFAHFDIMKRDNLQDVFDGYVEHHSWDEDCETFNYAVHIEFRNQVVSVEVFSR